ncbi:MAG: helix-turn-helix domain-containing protein [Oscillospiraceae bacterium]|nr:helix-turn-helix domain-containing protein [Oscillospiraceae bacterium]
MKKAENDGTTAFWQRVDHQMNLLSMDQKTLWQELQISASTGAGWRSKHRMPPTFICLKIAQVLGVSLEYLLTGQEILSTDDTTYLSLPASLSVAEAKVPKKQTATGRALPAVLLEKLLFCSELDYQKVLTLLKISLPPQP